MAKAATTGRAEKGRFGPGNPGRPKGARHRITLAVERLLDDDAKAITKKAIELAKGGDTTALRLCLERIAPPRKGRLVSLPGLPTVGSAADVPAAVVALLESVAAGEITTDEASDLAALLERYIRAVETADIDHRLRAIEEKLGGTR